MTEHSDVHEAEQRTLASHERRRKWRLAFLVLTAMLASLFALTTTTAASAAPTCASADSDPDGDGWGWENDQSCKVAEVTVPSNLADCDYSEGHLHGGWGWNPVTKESCPPVEDQPVAEEPIEETVETVTPVSSDGDCDYSEAHIHGGWGWNPVAKESCPPIDDQPAEPETIETAEPVSSNSDCDYSEAHLHGGWGWNPVARESCEPVDDQPQLPPPPPVDASDDMSDIPGIDTPECLGDDNVDCIVRIANPNTSGGLDAAIRTTEPHTERERKDSGFRTHCAISHFSYDDALKHPDDPEATHLHMFFGNTSADAYSTNEAGQTGDPDHLLHPNNRASTCSDLGAFNHSAYWMPALYNHLGEVVLPYDINVYYKTLPPSNRNFINEDGEGIPQQLQSMIEVPNDLSMVGRTGKVSIQQINGRQVLQARVEFKNCVQLTSGELQAFDQASLDANGQDRDETYEMTKTNDSIECTGANERRIPTLEFNVNWLIDGETKLGAGPWEFSNGKGFSDLGASSLTSFGELTLDGLHGDYMAAWSDRMDEVLTCNQIGNSCRPAGFDADLGKIDTPDGTQILVSHYLNDDIDPVVNRWVGMPGNMDMG